MSIVQWPHAVSTQSGKCVCLCKILILRTWIRVFITLMLAQYVITKMLWRWNINIMDYEINKMSYLLLSLSLCIKVQNEKCIWKIFIKYTQIRQSNTNTNTNISSGGFSNTNTNTNTDICVFKYKYKYVFDPSPAQHRAWYIFSNDQLPPSGGGRSYIFQTLNSVPPFFSRQVSISYPRICTLSGQWTFVDKSGARACCQSWPDFYCAGENVPYSTGDSVFVIVDGTTQFHTRSNQGPVSISDKTSYCEISLSIKDVRSSLQN